MGTVAGENEESEPRQRIAANAEHDDERREGSPHRRIETGHPDLPWDGTLCDACHAGELGQSRTTVTEAVDRAWTRPAIVAVRHQPEAWSGDIVLARIDNEVTLKRYERTRPHTMEFQPANTNPEHEPIRVDARGDYVAIVRVVIGAISGTQRGAERARLKACSKRR